jgi:hypothetical protein
MRAIVQDKYGPSPDVLELREIDKPVVGEEDVLVRVRAVYWRRRACSGMLTAASAVVSIVRSTSSCESRPPCSSVLAA